MTTTLAQLDAQIAKLQRKADQIRTREKAGVVARIKQAIAYYDLSAADLGFSGRGASRGTGRTAANGAGRAAANGTESPRGRRRAGPKRKYPPVPVKYRDEEGNTWTGRGSQPRWVRAALADGKTLEQLRVPDN